MDNRNCKPVGKNEMKIKRGNEYEKVKVTNVEGQQEQKKNKGKKVSQMQQEQEHF